MWIFRFCFFSRACREENFPARESDISASGSRRVQPRLSGPPGKRAILSRFRFLSKGCKEENFPATESGGVSARKGSRRFAKTWPRRSAILLGRSCASRRPSLIIARASPLRRRAGRSAIGPSRRPDRSQGPRAAEAVESPETVRVRRMRDPEPHVRSPPDPQPPPDGRWRRSWTARKFRGGRGRNLGVRFLRGDGHDVSESRGDHRG